jgi:hypothetical protein
MPDDGTHLSLPRSSAFPRVPLRVSLGLALPSTARPRPCRYAYEIFECLRKLALVGVPVFFPDPGGIAQQTYGLLICFLTFGIQTSFMPYVSLSDDRLAQLAQVQIFLALLAAVVLRASAGEDMASAMDVTLTVLTFVPIILAILLSSPMADSLDFKGWAGAEKRLHAAEQAAMHGVSNRLRRLRSHVLSSSQRRASQDEVHL